MTTAISPFGITSLIITVAFARMADRKDKKIGASTNLELELAKTVEQITGYTANDFFTRVVEMENTILHNPDSATLIASTLLIKQDPT